jgi:hypothetical protein
MTTPIDLAARRRIAIRELLDAIPEPRSTDTEATRLARSEQRTRLLAELHDVRESDPNGYTPGHAMRMFGKPPPEAA